MSKAYKQAGVDVDMATKILEESGVAEGDPKSYAPSHLGKLYSVDGIGTKLKYHIEFNTPGCAAKDLLYANVNDIVAQGGIPEFFMNYVNFPNLGANKDWIVSFLKSLKEETEKLNMKLLGGELSETKGSTPSITGFAGGRNSGDDLNRTKEKPGDVVIGILTNSLHCNGFSILDKDFIREHVDSLSPTKEYVSLLQALNQYWDHSIISKIHSMANVTGGGLFRAINRLLPREFSLEINPARWIRSYLYDKIETRFNIPTKEMYSIFNMGIGFLLLVNQDYIESTSNCLQKYNFPYVNLGKIKKTEKRPFLVHG